VISEIKKRQETGLPINAGAVQKGEHADNKLYVAAASKRYFGSWEVALRAAGVNLVEVIKRVSWTKAKVIREIKKRQEAGHPLNVRALRKGEHTDRKLYQAAVHKNRFGSWKAALEAAGVDPKDVVKRKLENWTKAKLIAEIKKRHEAGLPLNASAVSKGEDADRKLYVAARSKNHFGSWAAALEAAGVDPEEVVKYENWTKAKVITEIKKRQQAGHPLNAWAVQGGEDADRKLYVAAKSKNHFGSWEAALRAAGVDPDEVVKHESWTKEKVIREIKNRQQRGHPLNTREVIKGEHSDNKLYAAAISKRRFGSWESALEAAGVDPDEALKQRQKSWTNAKVITEIKKRQQAGHPLNAWAVQQGEYADRKLYAAAMYKNHFGSWEAALRAAGVDPDEVALQVNWTKAKVIREIKKRQEAGHPLNARAVQKGEHVDLKLYAAAISKNRFGSWEAALEAAGVDPDEVALQVNWTKGKIITEIKKRRQAGLPLNGGALQRGEYADRKLHGAARRYFKKEAEPFGLSAWAYAVKIALGEEILPVPPKNLLYVLDEEELIETTNASSLGKQFPGLEDEAWLKSIDRYDPVIREALLLAHFLDRFRIKGVSQEEFLNRLTIFDHGAMPRSNQEGPVYQIMDLTTFKDRLHHMDELARMIQRGDRIEIAYGPEEKKEVLKLLSKKSKIPWTIRHYFQNAFVPVERAGKHSVEGKLPVILMDEANLEQWQKYLPREFFQSGYNSSFLTVMPGVSTQLSAWAIQAARLQNQSSDRFSEMLSVYLAQFNTSFGVARYEGGRLIFNLLEIVSLSYHTSQLVSRAA